MRRSTLAILIIIVILAAAAIIALANHSSNNNPQTQSSNSSTSSNTSSEQASGAINIRNMMFTPSQITVAKGGKVTWTNNDTTTHTVVDDLSSVGGPNSGPIAPGSAYTFKFNNTGSFQYHCSIHPSMRGTIVVK